MMKFLIVIHLLLMGVGPSMILPNLASTASSQQKVSISTTSTTAKVISTSITPAPTTVTAKPQTNQQQAKVNEQKVAMIIENASYFVCPETDMCQIVTQLSIPLEFKLGCHQTKLEVVVELNNKTSRILLPYRHGHVLNNVQEETSECFLFKK